MDAQDDTAERPGHPAAYAANWRRILATDAGVGLVAVVIGVVVIVSWNTVAGAAVAALGCTYVAMVHRRFTIWRDLRRDAGLPT